jgi:hypothetical protein
MCAGFIFMSWYMCRYEGRMKGVCGGEEGPGRVSVLELLLRMEGKRSILPLLVLLLVVVMVVLLAVVGLLLVGLPF